MPILPWCTDGADPFGVSRAIRPDFLIGLCRRRNKMPEQMQGDPPHELGDFESYEEDTYPLAAQPGDSFKKGPSSHSRTNIIYAVQIVLREGSSGFPHFNP